MKKIALLLFLSAFILTSYNLYAEDTQSSTPEVVAPVVAAVVETPAKVVAPVVAEPQAVTPVAPEAVVASAEAAPAVPAEAPAPAAEVPATEERVNTENLEFISGEVTAMDEAAKTLTIKLYGETENDTNQKILTVKVDETTDTTDGEKDRDVKSLTAGTEVDVEYDPASNKATYIFVY